MWKIGCPACLGPAFFHGSNVAKGGVPVYAIVREYQDAWKTVDVVYHTFYPYNRGKLVCIGITSNDFQFSWFSYRYTYKKYPSFIGISTDKDKDGCLGNVESFGNHVGKVAHNFQIIVDFPCFVIEFTFLFNILQAIGSTWPCVSRWLIKKKPIIKNQ